jgi:hypothetical protein
MPARNKHADAFDAVRSALAKAAGGSAVSSIRRLGRADAEGGAPHPPRGTGDLVGTLLHPLGPGSDFVTGQDIWVNGRRTFE